MGRTVTSLARDVKARNNHVLVHSITKLLDESAF